MDIERCRGLPVPHGKKVWVDEYMLDELKDLLGLDGDAEAVHEAFRRISSHDASVTQYFAIKTPRSG